MYIHTLWYAACRPSFMRLFFFVLFVLLVCQSRLPSSSFDIQRADWYIGTFTSTSWKKKSRYHSAHTPPMPTIRNPFGRRTAPGPAASLSPFTTGATTSSDEVDGDSQSRPTSRAGSSRGGFERVDTSGSRKTSFLGLGGGNKRSQEPVEYQLSGQQHAKSILSALVWPDEREMFCERETHEWG